MYFSLFTSSSFFRIANVLKNYFRRFYYWRKDRSHLFVIPFWYFRLLLIRTLHWTAVACNAFMAFESKRANYKGSDEMMLFSRLRSYRLLLLHWNGFGWWWCSALRLSLIQCLEVWKLAGKKRTSNLIQIDANKTEAKKVYAAVLCLWPWERFITVFSKAHQFNSAQEF